MSMTSKNEYYDCTGLQLVPIKLLCGNIAVFDHESGISHRCTKCMRIVGSTGMPRSCKELYDMEDVVKRLKGK
jgi:hypothetical protein